MEERKFYFRSLTPEEERQIPAGGSKLRNIADCGGIWDAKVYGQLKTLFGEPVYETEDLEQQYEYCIEAKDDKGICRYLRAYSGPSGPAIGGEQGELDQKAADQLAELILSSEPSDYQYEGIYCDGPCRVRMGVLKGTAYYEENELAQEEGI